MADPKNTGSSRTENGIRKSTQTISSSTYATTVYIKINFPTMTINSLERLLKG